MLKRVFEAEMETRCKKLNTALNRFFKKYPQIEYWREHFEYMAENNQDFFCDDTMADGTKNNNWSYALHLDIEEDYFFIAVIEREEVEEEKTVELELQEEAIGTKKEYVVRRNWLKYGNETDPVEQTVKYFDTFDKAYAYAKRYAKGVKFVSASIEEFEYDIDKNGNYIKGTLTDDLLYEILDYGMVETDYRIAEVVKVEETAEVEEVKEEKTVTRFWKVYGVDGHRQRESFFESYSYDFSRENDARAIEVFNSDKTGTNDYTIVKITRNTFEECQRELDGQVSDGIFENSRIGMIEEITEELFQKIIKYTKNKSVA